MWVEDEISKILSSLILFLLTKNIFWTNLWIDFENNKYSKYLITDIWIVKDS